MAAGEVLLNGTQIGTAGDAAAPLSNLVDANEITDWFVDSGPAWAGMDAGVPCQLTRVRFSPFGGQADEPLQATIEGDSVTTNFAPRGFIQGNYFAVNTPASPQTLTFNANNTAGNCLVLWISLSTATVSSIGSSAGNTYTLAQGSANGSTLVCYVAANCVGAAADTVTLNFTGSPGGILMMIQEYAGIVTSNPVNTSANASGSSTQASVSVTTTTQNSIVVGAFIGPSGVGIAGTGFLLRNDFTFVHKTGSQQYTASTEDTTVTATGTYSPSFTWTGGASGGWFCCAIALQHITPPNTFFTISNRPLTGALANEYLITNAPLKRYWAYVSPAGIPGIVSDLDFIVQYTAGVAAAAVAPNVVTKGRQFDFPVVIQLSCITTDATIYYTLDGTTPTSGSTPYTGPFVLSTTATLKAIAISSGLSNSRITTAKFYIPSAIVSTDAMYDDRNQRILGLNPQFFFDPVSKWWYQYAQQVDYAGIFWNGYVGQNVYKSADLRNWIFVSEMLGPPYGNATLANRTFAYQNRIYVFYNALNNNYVLWTDLNNTSPNFPQMQVLTSPTPTGPWTQFALYTTFNSTSLSDVTPFADDNGDGWLMCTTPTGDLLMTKLNPSYTNVDGVNFAVLSKATFGIASFDGAHMHKNAGVYFLVSNAQNNWVSIANVYWTATNPLGPWSQPSANPFVPVQGGNPDYTTAYDTQQNFVLQVPGRKMLCYGGDRYDTGLANNVAISSTNNFQSYRFILLPITFPTPTTMSINWNPSWTFDGIFASVSGLPMGPSGLNLLGSVFSWRNNEPNPAVVYLDYSLTSTFTSVAWSEVISFNNPSPQSYTPIMPVQSSGYYRIRTVNANGTSISLAVSPPTTRIPVTVSGSGYYVIFTVEGTYNAIFLTAGKDYSWFIQSVTSGPYPDSGTAETARIAVGNPPYR